MNAVRQRCRPKHQVLILKCYPRFQKNVQEVKPNPSELSYLLYYTSSRRSKLQKVGAFLERKAASDVAKNRLGYGRNRSSDAEIDIEPEADKASAILKSPSRSSRLSSRNYRVTSLSMPSTSSVSLVASSDPRTCPW